MKYIEKPRPAHLKPRKAQVCGPFQSHNKGSIVQPIDPIDQKKKSIDPRGRVITEKHTERERESLTNKKEREREKEKEGSDTSDSSVGEGKRRGDGSDNERCDNSGGSASGLDHH